MFSTVYAKSSVNSFGLAFLEISIAISIGILLANVPRLHKRVTGHQYSNASYFNNQISLV
jgi:hypothetical protein